MVYSLVYVSTATQLLTQDDLDDILATAHRHNGELGVTGALLYIDGNIMQVLEGEEQTVRDLYTRIAVDPRHHGLITIWEGDRPERQFPSWTMAYRNLDLDDDKLSGYSEFLNTRRTDNQDFGPSPSVCQRLLMSFRRTLAASSSL